MKKNFTKLLSAFIVVTLLTCSVTMSASANFNAMNESQWAAYWGQYVSDGKAVCLAPGSNDTEMRFAWLSDSNESKPVVKISTNPNMSESLTFEGCYVSSKSVACSAHVTVKGLEADTKYYYQCGTGADFNEAASFKTVEKASDFSAVYLTDIHISGDDLQKDTVINSSLNLNNIFAAALEKDDKISLVVSGGDNADAGRVPEYIGLFSSPILKTIPFALTIGNHDSNTTNFKYVTNNPNIIKNPVSRSLLGGDYWFVKGNALFLMIDSTNSSAIDHYNFVKSAVAANPDVKWRIAAFHHDLYGGHSPNREGENKLLRILLTPIFDKFAVDLVLMGHSHVFSRSHVLFGNKVSQNLTGQASVKDAKGTIYFVSGSANRPRLPDGKASDWIAFDYISDKDMIYNIINFGSDKLTINSYILGNDEDAFETFTIEKTGTNGGHPVNDVPFWYPGVQLLGTTYNFINNISRGIGYLTEK